MQLKTNGIILKQRNIGENDRIVTVLTQDMGLIEGTSVECVGKSPLGDPAAYLVRGAVIALRSQESDRIFIRYAE